MLEAYFNKIVKTQRLIKDDDESPKDVEEYQDYLTDVSCMIQPLEDSFGEDLSGSYGKSFLMFCGNIDIEEKDKIIDGENEYIVVGIKSYDFMNDEHLELTIRLTQ